MDEIKITRKPQRKTLLKVIGRLQYLVGKAQSQYQNDRSSDRADQIQATLEEAFDLCLEARQFDDVD